jgi:hypothetical protein
MTVITLYGASEDVRHFCGMLDGLAFLLVDSAFNGHQSLKGNTPDGVETILKYFE